MELFLERVLQEANKMVRDYNRHMTAEDLTIAMEQNPFTVPR
jgi:hypothetical protein